MRLTLPMDGALALWADLAFALRQEAACGDVSPAFARAQSRDKTLDN